MSIYLDNNASTQLDPRVIKEMQEAMQEQYGNPASVTHAWGWRAEELIKIARERIAQAIGAKNSQEIVFTSCATEASNLAILGHYELAKHKRFIISAIEHKATLECTKILRSKGSEVVILNTDNLGLIDLEQLERELKKPTDLVSIIGANNEIGTIQDLNAISKLVKSANSLLHLDLVQALGKIELDFKTLNLDFASFSAHKIYGPKGVGALYVKSGNARLLKAQIVGGGQEHGLRAGTLNLVGIVGFGRAAQLASSELSENTIKITELTSTLFNGLRSKLQNLTLNGHPKQRILGNLNLRIDNIRAERLISALANKVALSSSSACLAQLGQSSHVLEAIGLNKTQIESSFRIGVGKFNTCSEISDAITLIATELAKS